MTRESHGTKIWWLEFWQIIDILASADILQLSRRRIGLGLNLGVNQLLLQLPDTTADLLGGNLGAAALTKAILYYVVLGLMSFVAVAGQVQAQSHGVKRARDSVWKKMLGMRMEYFDRNDRSDLMSAIINDSGNAVNDMVNIIGNLIPDFIMW